MFYENEFHVLLMFLRLAATVAVAATPFALLAIAMKLARRLGPAGKRESGPHGGALAREIAPSSPSWLHSSDLCRGARLRSPLVSAIRINRSPEVSIGERRQPFNPEAVFSTTRTK